MHGPLLGLRYLLGEINFTKELSSYPLAKVCGGGGKGGGRGRGKGTNFFFLFRKIGEFFFCSFD